MTGDHTTGPDRRAGARPTTTAEARAALAAEGLRARAWDNGPGDAYARHAHDHHKVLYCVAGSIVFHTDDGERALVAGDRLDLPAGVGHAATVGPDGVACVEAYRP